jgi:hypothetical protein
MDRNDGLKYAGYAAIGLLVIGVLEALGRDNFVYGLGLSIACNISTLAFGAALVGAILAIDPVCRYFGREPRTVHWSVKTAFVIAVVMVVAVVVPRPRDCPSSSSEYDDY